MIEIRNVLGPHDREEHSTVLPGEVVPNQFWDTSGACFDPYLAIETSYDHNFFLNVLGECFRYPYHVCLRSRKFSRAILRKKLASEEPHYPTLRPEF